MLAPASVAATAAAVLTISLLGGVPQGVDGKDCAAREEGDSFVCVCNVTYCDTLDREYPERNTFVQYTSTKKGLRFSKTTGEVNAGTMSTSDIATASLTGKVVLKVNTSKQFQKIEGFGGAVTDASSINWLNLSEPLQEILIQSYFGPNGLEYNMARVPIGGSDFSTHAYAYNELPENDTELSNFTLTVEDTDYKLHMLRAAMKVATDEIHIVATTWSPPLWMKTNGQWSGFSRLKEEYYQTYADYHLKFLQLYKKNEVKIWAITMTNEPVNGVIPWARFNSLGWTPSKQAEWLVANLGPTLRKSADKDISGVKILAVDDQRITVPVWIEQMVSANSSVLDYLSGVAVHYYTDFIVPAKVISWTHDHYPQLFVLATEACEGSYPWQLKKVDLGSWSRAKAYISDIITDMNNWIVGWLDWNMCLNASGGPNWAGNNVDSPVIVFPESGEFVKQPMFYAMGHFAKFVSRGSVRVEAEDASVRDVEHAAFVTPRDTIVLVLHNGGLQKTVHVQVDEARQFPVDMPADSIATVELLK